MTPVSRLYLEIDVFLFFPRTASKLGMQVALMEMPVLAAVTNSILTFGRDFKNIYVHSHISMYTCTHVQEAGCSQSLGYKIIIRQYPWDQYLEGRKKKQ